MKTCYYAHFKGIYNTPQEERDITLIRKLGFEPINPNTPEVAARCARLKERGIEESIMHAVFQPLVKQCDVLAFRGLPDGKIPSGVFTEILYAKEFGMPIIELPSGLSLGRALNLLRTRAYLEEWGER